MRGGLHWRKASYMNRPSFRPRPRPGARMNGEVAEWSKAHAWKVCIRQKRIVGSNPTLSASISFTVVRNDPLESP